MRSGGGGGERERGREERDTCARMHAQEEVKVLVEDLRILFLSLFLGGVDIKGLLRLGTGSFGTINSEAGTLNW